MFTQVQYFLPQHLLSRLVAMLMRVKIVWIKNALIHWFIRTFDINVSEAASENLDDYPHFNAFFTRELRSDLRPLAEPQTAVVSPADGTISQIGQLQGEQILQAKSQHYQLEALVGDGDWAHEFIDGSFATIYLAPSDYHRVHMPLTGNLHEMVYIPGQLFSVNPQTVLGVPNLFARNERIVCYFKTESGPMVVILVGAMLVAGIETVWSGVVAPRKHELKRWVYETSDVTLLRGQELGRFQYGSTVIVLFPKGKVTWEQNRLANTTIKMGERLALKTT